MKAIHFLLFLVLATALSGCAQQDYDIDPSTNNDVGPSTDVESYIACGCGCCGGEEPLEQCLYRSQGDDIQNIIEEDQQMQNNPQCAMMGCSLGTKYIYCD